MKRVTEDFIQKKTATVRKLFVMAIGISIASGLCIYAGQQYGLYNGASGFTLAIVLTISVFSIATGNLIKALNKISEKQREAEVRRFEVKDEVSANEVIYYNLIENSGVVMYTTTINGNITFSSSKALQLTGYSLKELSGMHFTTLIADDWLEEVKTKYKNQVKNNIEETNMEFCIRTKSGQVKWVEQSAILISENNEPVGFQCIVKEISERKEMEAVLRKYEVELVQNQERLQSILDNTTSLMYIKDLDGRYQLVNERFKEVLKVTDNTVIGKTDFDFAERKQAMRFKYSDDEVIRTGKPVQLEEIIEMEDGKHHILIIKFPLVNANNEIYGISGIATDISERVRYEEQLIEAKRIAEDAKKLQEQFLANMSHEIRTPMNGIQGMTDLLLETNLTTEQADFTKTIKRSSDNLLVIINDILDFSKIQAGKLTIEKIDFKLHEVIDNIKAIFRYRIHEKGLALRFSVDENIPVVLNGDPYRLNQVLVNLIGNAIKFTNEGNIDVNIAVGKKSAEEIFLKFSIADTGIGIPEDKINLVFESFTQASTETTRKYGGTGLGLAISKQLLEIQRGTISVESKMNAGTIFTFSIPYGYGATNNSANLKGTILKDYHSLLKDKKFLVAEDNEVNQKVIMHVLKKAGGTVTIANNGAEAIDFLKKDSNYDLIIMDLQMPEMDGYTATKYIRNEMKLSVPVIAMTASALKGEKTKCLEIGMSEYLSKPFDAAFLYKRISELINQNTPIQKLPFMTNEKPKNETLFDLSLLEEMDDNGYVVEIVTTYLNNAPGELRELAVACNSSSFDAVYKAAHKLKGSTSLLQANSLLKILVKLEEFAKSEISDGLSVLADQAGEEYKNLEGPLREYVRNMGITPSVTK
jgi:PAS domain S-box-containing protein